MRQDRSVRPQERFLVFAAMRNEGAFIVEWVCWYRMLGFRVLIAWNDCTDHSPALLAALAAAGWIETFEHCPGTDAPKYSAHRALRAHPRTAATDWLLICDVDEFLVLDRGDGTIVSYLDGIGRDHPGVSFHWRCFGTGGARRWRDLPVHRRFTACVAGQDGVNTGFKTLFRDPLRYHLFRDHAPDWRDGRPGLGGIAFVDAAGRPIEEFRDSAIPLRATVPERICHAPARMNHYILRDRETFDLKRGTLSATGRVDRYTDAFFNRRNRGPDRDGAALVQGHRFAAIHAAAMALPGVARLHHLCCADHVARIRTRAGLAPEGDPRWQHHMAAAAAPGTARAG